MFGSFAGTGLAGKAWHGYSALRRLQLEVTRSLQRPSLYNQHATPPPLLSAQWTLQYIHPPTHTCFSFYCPSLSSTFLGKKERTDSLQIFLCLSHGSHFLSYHGRFAEHPCDLVVVDTMESFKDPLKRPCWFPCFLVYGCWFRKPNLSTVESHLIPPLLPWYLPRSLFRMGEGGFHDGEKCQTLQSQALPIPGACRHTTGYDWLSGKDKAVCPSLLTS